MCVLERVENDWWLFRVEHYLLSVYGLLTIKGDTRYFTQNFILEKLCPPFLNLLYLVDDTPRVFYIRAETLSLLSSKTTLEKSTPEPSSEQVQELSSATSDRESRRVSDHAKTQERKKYQHRDDARSRESSSRPLFEMYGMRRNGEVESS